MWKKIDNDNAMTKNWDFTITPKLDGVYVSSKGAKSKMGKPITFHTFTVKDELVSVLGGTVLDRMIGGLAKGDRVLIEFEGTKVGKNGPYKAYSFSRWDEGDTDEIVDMPNFDN